MLVIMFTGTQFFIARDKQTNTSSERKVTFFNLSIISLALLLYTGIFVYHFIIRFPKLKAFIMNAWSKIHKLLFKKKLIPSEESNENESNKENIGPRVTFSEVSIPMHSREYEYLLEDSFII